MENASKALIIAGAILLAILIIGLGVFIYNQASNTVGETGMDQVAIRQFNGQFEPYINKTIDSTAAKALIDTAKIVSESGTNRVELLGVTSKNNIKTGHKYIVEPNYENGLITKILVSDTDGSTQIEDENGGNGGTIISDNSIEESTDDFNKLFERYLGDNKTEEDYRELNSLIMRINERYGKNTVILSGKEIPDDAIIDSCSIQVTGRYTDDKIREITVYFTFHSLVDEFNAQFYPYVPTPQQYQQKFLYPKTAVTLVEIIEKSNRSNEWQVTTSGYTVVDDGSYQCYAIWVTYDDSTGRLKSVGFHGRDSIPDNII